MIFRQELLDAAVSLWTIIIPTELWNKYDACNSGIEPGLPKMSMWKNNEVHTLDSNSGRPCQNWILCHWTIRATVDVINLHKAVLARSQLGEQTLWMELIFSSSSFGNIVFHSWKLVILSLGEYCFQIRPTRRLVGFYFYFWNSYLEFWTEVWLVPFGIM